MKTYLPPQPDAPRRRTPRGSLLPAVVVACLIGGVFLGGAASATAAPAGPHRFPTAVSFNGLLPVGALFAGPVQTTAHFCSASVVHSPGHNLVLTAAHCIQGTGAGVSFAPKFHDGVAPYGVWQVTGAYVDKRWIARQDPQTDFAFLTVAARTVNGHRRNVEDLTGANRLRIDGGFRNWATVVGYPAGVGGRPIICANETYRHDGFPGFNCHGYVGGTSGGPWLLNFSSTTHTGYVNGVIGGLHQGGCFEYTSYTSYFDVDTASVYYRAVHGGRSDVVGPAGGDGC